MRLFAAIERHPRLKRLSLWLAGSPVLGPLWARLQANPKELERFFKFAIVGIIGAVVDFTVLNLMKTLFESMALGVTWGVADPHEIQLAVANTISFSAAVLSNFTWNRLWTFPESRTRPIRSQLAQYTVVNIVGWGINTFLLIVLDRYLFQHMFAARVSYNLAKALSTIVVLFWNFGVNRAWTYRGIK